MPSVIVTVEIETEVFYERVDGVLTPTTVQIETSDVPVAAQGWLKALAIEKFERMVERGEITN